jgi:hypothetical protein
MLGRDGRQGDEGCGIGVSHYEVSFVTRAQITSAIDVINPETEVLLAPYAVCLANESRQFALQLRRVAQFERVHVVSGRDCFDLAETWILVPLGKHQVPAEVAPSGHDRGE